MRKPGVKAFVIYDKKLLLILRDNKPEIDSPNMWNLPGGGIEEGEPEKEAMRRELVEEINVDPKDLTYLGRHSYPDESEVFRFLVKLTEKERQGLKLGEGQRMDFFRGNEIANLDLSEYFKEYFIKYKDQIIEIVENDKQFPPSQLGLVK